MPDCDLVCTVDLGDLATLGLRLVVQDHRENGLVLHKLKFVGNEEQKKALEALLNGRDGLYVNFL